MLFAQPWILWLLPLGLIPIVIYYLLRFRSLRVTWGANYVLELALARLKRRLHLDQIILMALRILAVVGVILAFARPTMRQPSSTLTGSGTHHVIILDGSYSMLAGPPGSPDKRRWNMAIDAAGKLVAGWGRGETWSLCLLESQPRWVVERQAVGSSEQAIALLNELKPSECSSSVTSALAHLTQKFPADHLQVFILADDQASTWTDAERSTIGTSQRPEIIWLNPASDHRHNLAITAVRPGSDRVLAGHPSRVAVSVRNFSPAKVEDVRVELLLDGSFIARQGVSLLPDQEATIRFDLSPADAGSHHLSAQLPDDALDFDNQGFAAIEVVDRLVVAVPRDPQRTGKFDSIWGFIETFNRSTGAATGATSSAGSGSASGDTPGSGGGGASGEGRVVWRLIDGAVDSESLTGVDVVLLDGGRRVTAELAQSLRSFVDRGGGLILAPDPSVDAQTWNRELARVNLLPGRLGPLRTEALGGDRFRSLARDPIALSPLRLFESDEAGDLTQARIYSWFDLQPIDEHTLAVLRMDNQSPWALRRLGDDGLGRVVLLASGLGGSGNNLAVREFFVPLLHAMTQDAAASNIYPRTVGRGEALRLRLTDPATINAVTFGRRGEDAQPIAPRKLGPSTIAQMSDGALESGLYSFLTVRGGDSQRSWFAVRGPRVDSDLTPIAPSQIEALRQRWGMTTVANWAELDQALQRQRSGNEWHGWVLVAAALFLICEMLFQRRFAPEPIRTRTQIGAGSIP